ncbi:hypothetical protein [Paeniglutamicibacter cryotolerans]|uniref:DUF4439 domain-containing protein n=2 Tax=Paeniglutamicibacter cryotolerans TaxID=670079 RepID=A0A839QIB7_9MICC|nr:hypothetical protein [Paeniglutamicibacter cryotolerans]
MAIHDDPSSPGTTRPRRRKGRAPLLTAGILVALLSAVAVTGGGMYLQRDTPEWQRFWGNTPVVVPDPAPTDDLGPLLADLRYMIAYPESSTNARTTAALQASVAMLEKHVELLTPGASAAAEADPRSAPATDAPVAALPPLSVSAFSTNLAKVGNNLLKAGIQAPEQEARRLSGSGIELILQARNIASAAGASAADIDGLPSPATNWPVDAQSSAVAGEEAPSTGASIGLSAQEGLPELTFGACPTTEQSASDAALDPAAGQSGLLLGQVIDAAYSMGYAYDVAGARRTGTLRTAAWDREKVLVGFASTLEGQVDASWNCAPLRQAAYQLPADARQNPLDAARSGEGQLALLLRDAAATQSGEARSFLLRTTWFQALQARQVTGIVPDFMRVQSTQESPETTMGSPTAPSQ